MSVELSIGYDSARATSSAARTVTLQVRSEPAPVKNVTEGISTVQAMKKAEASGTHIPVSEEQLIRAIDRAIHAMQGKSTSLEFSVHDQTNQIMVKVLDKDTGEVIREIPPEKSLDFVAKLMEMAGILVDERR